MGMSFFTEFKRNNFSYNFQLLEGNFSTTAALSLLVTRDPFGGRQFSTDWSAGVVSG